MSEVSMPFQKSKHPTISRGIMPENIEVTLPSHQKLMNKNLEVGFLEGRAPTCATLSASVASSAERIVWPSYGPRLSLLECSSRVENGTEYFLAADLRDNLPLLASMRAASSCSVSYSCLREGPLTFSYRLGMTGNIPRKTQELKLFTNCHFEETTRPGSST